jgi:hypothetical protein
MGFRHPERRDPERRKYRAALRPLHRDLQGCPLTRRFVRQKIVGCCAERQRDLPQH